MALRINTNVAALNAHRGMEKNDIGLTNSLERLSTGLRINKAADDASGMSIADSLKAQSLGIGQAMRNANDGISMVQTADGALQEAINIVNTIKTKSIQAASDGQTTATRRAIQNDIEKLMEELDTIAATTSFNGQKLLSGAFTNKRIQIGAFANETANISIQSARSNKVGHISQADLSLASDNGGEVQLTITSSITGEKLTLTTIDIQYNNKRENGMGALASEINRYTSTTGISALAVIETTTTIPIQPGSTGQDFAINGVTIGAIPVEANDYSGALVNSVNKKSAESGVEAYLTIDGKLTLKSIDGRSIKVTGAISDITGSTSGEMSTIGHLKLTQRGVSQFQINGIGAGATGADIDISGDITTVDDSVLAAGSTINTGSMLSTGTIIGGDAIVESTVQSTQLDYNLKAGSSLYPFTQIAKGSIIGGSVTIAGNTIASAGTGVTALEQDMLITAGSTLKQYTTIGRGTVITTQFTSTSTGAVITYNVGDTLASSVLLSRDITLNSSMVLKYDSTTSDNSVIKAGSVFTNGSKLGAKFITGATYNVTDGSGAIAGGATLTANILLADSLAITGTGGLATLAAGTLIKDNTTFVFNTTGAAATSTWTGPTLETSSGTIEYGDTVQNGTTYTIDGDQVLSENWAFLTGGSMTLLSGSMLTANSVNGAAALSATDGAQVTLASAVMADDMILEGGSLLSAGSKLLSGSRLGNNTYVMGGALNATATNLQTYQRTYLQSGSHLENGSILAEGSTIGGRITVANDETLDSDMSITTGSILGQDTLIKAGTVINQDMTLVTTTGVGGTAVQIKEGDVLTTDLYVHADTTLSNDMMLLKGSIIDDGSILAVNTTNSGTVGLGETETYKLADIDVLSQTGAQTAITIADSALNGLDEVRSKLGSIQNQLNSTIANLSITKTNIQASESVIRDVDFAEESMVFSKMKLLGQTSSYALAQANAATQNVMTLLQ